MYPKVKVRNQEDDDQLSFYDQVAFDSVSLDHLDSSVWDDEDDSPPMVVRVPDSYQSDLAIEGEDKSIDKKKDMECGKQNIRASSVPPPRAVLSSPVNDGRIENGSRNKSTPDLQSGLKDHNLCDRHTRCKVLPTPGTREPWCHHMQGTREPWCYHSHRTAREATATAARRVSKEASTAKPNLDGKKGSATASPKQRSKVRKERPEFVCI